LDASRKWKRWRAALKAYIGHYGKDSVTTIYTGDGSLPTDRTIDLNGHNLEFQQSGVDWFSMIPGNFTTQIRATDGTGTTYLVLNADVSDPTVKFELYSDNGTNEVSILGNATTDNIAYTADTHTFNAATEFKVVNGTAQIDLYSPDQSAVFQASPSSKIVLDANAVSATYTADTHTFNGEKDTIHIIGCSILCKGTDHRAKTGKRFSRHFCGQTEVT
jgi:hypothetical protein